jgi:hypothetical protein
MKTTKCITKFYSPSNIFFNKKHVHLNRCSFTLSCSKYNMTFVSLIQVSNHKVFQHQHPKFGHMKITACDILYLMLIRVSVQSLKFQFSTTSSVTKMKS